MRPSGEVSLRVGLQASGSASDRSSACCRAEDLIANIIFYFHCYYCYYYYHSYTYGNACPMKTAQNKQCLALPRVRSFMIPSVGDQHLVRVDEVRAYRLGEKQLSKDFASVSYMSHGRNLLLGLMDAVFKLSL